MQEVILLYNPKAGDTYFRFELDEFIAVFNTAGYDTRIFRSRAKGDMAAYLLKADLSNVAAVFVAGGDGSINEVVNGLMNCKHKVPLGVIPAGTSNDFARSLGFPSEYEKCINLLANMQMEDVDVGCVNGRYFINVCGAGLFTNVSQTVNIDLKNLIGKMAYYLKGAGQLPSFRPFKLRVEANGEVYEDNFILFLVLNSGSAGGFKLATDAALDDGLYDFVGKMAYYLKGAGQLPSFRPFKLRVEANGEVYEDNFILFLVLNSGSAGGFKLATDAALDDGLYDFVGIRQVSLPEMTLLLVRMLKGEHLKDKSVLHLQSNHFLISSENIQDDLRESDVDGESGPLLPLEIDVKPKALSLIVNRQNLIVAE